MKISIIIRTHNEERWIASCLRAVFAQNFQDFEVIIVDNESTDATLARVEQFPVAKVLSCTDYLPGKSLNIGINEAWGEFIACLSGHCIPVNNYWLENLIKNFDDLEVAGVYGRQEPLSFTPSGDKRDLMIVFGPERRVQRKDSFFHNANSMIRKEVLDKHPFDPKVTNIEDRLWAKEVLSHDYKIIYEPEASVYHYHGIHQDGNEERCRNVVRILEELDNKTYELNHLMQVRDLNIVAMIPLKGECGKLGDVSLLECAINSTRHSKYIQKTVVSTDNRNTVDMALNMGADLAFLRDESLSQEYVGLEKVYNFTLQQLENDKILPDLVVLLEVTYPFRDQDLIDKMIDKFVFQGLDTVLPARIEANSIWKTDKDGNLQPLDEGLVPRQYKKPIYVSYKGLCCVTRPEFIRNEEIIGPKIGFLKINNPYAGLEFRDGRGLNIPAALLLARQFDKGKLTIQPHTVRTNKNDYQ